MSAFMVSKKHIDAIVTTAYYGPKGVQRGQWYAPYFNDSKLEPVFLNELGEMLTKENLSSIHSRYPDTISDPDATPGPIEQFWMEPYKFEKTHRPLTAVEALKVLSCYEYQSCEHPEWKTSQARKYCEQLRHALIGCLPGYEDAPWEWGEIAV